MNRRLLNKANYRRKKFYRRPTSDFFSSPKSEPQPKRYPGFPPELLHFDRIRSWRRLPAP